MEAARQIVRSLATVRVQAAREVPLNLLSPELGQPVAQRVHRLVIREVLAQQPHLAQGPDWLATEVVVGEVVTRLLPLAALAVLVVSPVAVAAGVAQA